jgi:hypothetical protein
MWTRAGNIIQRLGMEIYPKYGPSYIDGAVHLLSA